MSDIDVVKDAIRRTLDICFDKHKWDKWARRFLLGIDKTQEASLRALQYNNDERKDETPSKAVFKSYARSYATAIALAWARGEDFTEHLENLQVELERSSG